MFTLIAMGTGVAYALQRRRHGRARHFSGRVPRPWRRGRGLFRGRRGHHRAGAARPGAGTARPRGRRRAPSGRCSIWRPRPRAASTPTAATKRSRSTASTVGDRLRVRPGEKVPVDGVMLEGRSSLDESMVTGESMPVTKEAGGKVIAGTLNQSGGFVMRADKVGRDTLLSQIVQMVAKAQRSRAPIQRLADQVAGWFVPAVIAVALLAFARLGDVRPGAAPRLRPGRRRQRADHRLPLRARPRDADVDHGRRRARRAGRRADQECRSAGAHGKGRHAGGRQDRHADRRQAEGGRDRRRRRVSTKPKCCGLRPASSASSEHPLADAIVRAAKERESGARPTSRTSIRRPARA